MCCAAWTAAPVGSGPPAAARKPSWNRSTVRSQTAAARSSLLAKRWYSEPLGAPADRARAAIVSAPGPPSATSTTAASSRASVS